MKKLIITMISSLLILYLSSSVLGQSLEIIEKYSKVKIIIQDKYYIKELQQAGLSLEGMKLEEQSVEVILSEREIMKLKDLGFSYEVLIDDMSKYYLERNRRSETEMKNLKREMKEKYSSGGFGFGSMGGYYTYDEIVAELDTMRILYPNLITEKYSIGTTLEGRTIWAVKISDNPGINENEPELFYNALVHGREPAGMMALIYFMYNLLESYGSDPEITYLVDNREFYIVPVINPDGYAYNQLTNPNGGGMWRKNRRDVGGIIYGVDLCRNYDYMWGYNNIGSSPNPPDETYRGTAPFSEPETQAVRDFCLGHNFIICNNFHSYGALVYAPWGYNLTQTPDSTIFNHTIGLATQLNNYMNWIDYPGIYERNGDHLDWQYGEQTTKPKIFAYLPETGNDNDGFWPVQGRIFPIAEENCYLNKILAWGPGIIENPPYILNASLNLNYCRPLLDTVKITAIEANPDNHTSNVFIQLLNLSDSLLNEIQLIKSDSIFTGSIYFNVPDENFYKIRFKQSGIDIPSNLFIDSKLRFTTAGPVKIDSIVVKKQLSGYSAKLYLHNFGITTPVSNGRVRLLSSDPWVTNLSTTPVGFPLLAPGTSVSSGTILFGRIDPLFPGYYNFKVEVMSDGWKYWVDSMKVIIPPNDVEEESNDIPTEFLLSQNYPNPFNPVTTIEFGIPEKGNIRLSMLNILGEEIKVLLNEEKEAGYHSVEFNGSDLPSGVYFYRIHAGSFIDTKKMILLK